MAYGAGMEQTFAERLADVRSAPQRVRLAAFVLREVCGVAAAAVCQRAAALRIITQRPGHKMQHTAETGPPPGWRRENIMASLLLDARHGLRSLIKSPGYTIVAVLTLGLGIGANTAMFSVVNGVLLQPLPYEAPNRLLEVWETDPQGRGFGFSPPNFVDYREETRLFHDIVAYLNTSFTLTASDEPERLQGMRVSAGFFTLLGSSIAHGRTFVPEDDVAGADPVVILSHGFWRRRFGGDDRVLGQTITLDGIPRVVVGITRPSFTFQSARVDLWTPFAFSESDLTGRGRHFLYALARLNDGVELETALVELQAVANRLAEAYPDTNTGWGIEAVPLLRMTVGRVQKPLLTILGAVGFVLLIACANVAHLSLARAEERGREMAVRSALGAARTRLLRLLLIESAMLGVTGGIAGLAMAFIGVRLLMTVIGSELPRAAEVCIDGTVLTFTVAVALVAGFAVGMVPALQGIRLDMQAALKDGARQARERVGKRRIRSVLVVAEIALSLMLVVGAGLMIKSFWLLTHTETGFDQNNLLTATISLPPSRYGTDADRAVFFGGLVERVGQRPGVVAAAATTGLPFVGGRVTTVTVPSRDNAEFRGIARRRVTPGYFRAMGIALMAGREFDHQDTPDSPHVVVVNETFVRHVFPNEHPLGNRLAWGGPYGAETLEIVGVVSDVSQRGFGETALPAMYLEYEQIYVSESMSLVVRTVEPPLDVVPEVREAVWALDPDLPVYDVATMEQIIADSVGGERISMLVLGTFAALALLLGAVGIYGVMSYTVSQRTQEVGVRMALGAAQSDVVGLVIRQGVLLISIGVTLGIAGALALGRLLSGMLYGVTTTDPFTFLSVSILLSAVGLAACYLPARRAAWLDPLEALRYE